MFRKLFRYAFRGVPHVLKYLLIDHPRFHHHPDKYTALEKMNAVRTVIKKVERCLYIDYIYENIEEVAKLDEKNQNYMMVANHQGMIDPFAPFNISKPVLTPVCKIELERNPIFRNIFSETGALYMDRDDLRQSVKIIKKAREILEEGSSSILIYPEGTRHKNPENEPLNHYHPGSFKAAMAASVPIVVIAAYGSFRVFDFHIEWKRFPIQYKVLKVLYPEDYKDMDTNQVAEYVERITNEEIVKMREIDAIYQKKGYHKIPLRKKIKIDLSK
ncbi:MAG: 1-acyl-sn-glycerol-3-phosphate acyltransferase [Bacilli bacterium]|nr:1-acyl-sn-glycerol-3-phosphate acyltransferase [Bacilli bacterium]